MALVDISPKMVNIDEGTGVLVPFIFILNEAPHSKLRGIKAVKTIHGPRQAAEY